MFQSALISLTWSARLQNPWEQTIQPHVPGATILIVIMNKEGTSTVDFTLSAVQCKPGCQIIRHILDAIIVRHSQVSHVCENNSITIINIALRMNRGAPPLPSSHTHTILVFVFWTGCVVKKISTYGIQLEAQSILQRTGIIIFLFAFFSSSFFFLVLF